MANSLPVSPAEIAAHTQTAIEEHQEPHFLGFDATGWVSIGMVILLGVMLWMKVPAMVARALDGKIARIKADLDEAANLRRQAELMMIEMQTRERDAKTQADKIIAHAREEAALYAAQAARDLDTLVERKTAAAESRIAAAERAAEADVRAKVADLAVEASRRLLATHLDGAAQAQLVDTAIAELDRRLH